MPNEAPQQRHLPFAGTYCRNLQRVQVSIITQSSRGAVRPGAAADMPGVAGQDPPDAGSETVSDPNGAVSFYDAVSRELGLKLIKEKRPEPVLVIDHIDEQPTPN